MDRFLDTQWSTTIESRGYNQLKLIYEGQW
jgi:hypothetical protein